MFLETAAGRAGTRPIRRAPPERGRPNPRNSTVSSPSLFHSASEHPARNPAKRAHACLQKVRRFEVVSSLASGTVATSIQYARRKRSAIRRQEKSRSLDPGEAHGAHKSRCATRRAIVRRERENRVGPLAMTEQEKVDPRPR